MRTSKQITLLVHNMYMLYCEARTVIQGILTTSVPAQRDDEKKKPWWREPEQKMRRKLRSASFAFTLTKL